MSANNTILKTFTRKLANCRYKVSPSALVDYMEHGQFGYTYDNGEEVVITNDTVFADDISAVIAHISAIFKEPHIYLKRDDIVQNVAVASKFDTVSLKHNYKDGKIWRVKDSEIKPEFVHTFVFEDNLAIYENRFVTALIDILLKTIENKIKDLYGQLDTLNSRVAGRFDPEIAGYTEKDYIDYAETLDNIPVLVTTDSPIVTAIGSLTKSQKILQSFKSRDLYKACKKAGEFSMVGLKETNIFLHDFNYNYVYYFYLHYLNKDPIFTTEKNMYRNFVLVNMLYSLKSLGFNVCEDNEDVSINNSANMIFDKIKVEQGSFNAELSTDGNDTIFLKLSESIDYSTALYEFKLISKENVKDIEGFKSIPDYTDKYLLSTPTNVVDRFVINEIQDCDLFNACYICPDNADVLKKIKFLLKCIFYRVEGAYFLHTRFCPVCGSSLISPDGDDYTCSHCETLYHVFPEGSHDIIWLKRLPKNTQPLNRAISNDNISTEPLDLTSITPVVSEENVQPVEEPVLNAEPVIEAEPVKEEPSPVIMAVPVINEIEEPVAVEVKAPVVATEDKTAIKKSFVAKLSQSANDNQEFYNELKNYLLTYKKICSRVSWHFDSFNLGRIKKFKIAVRGKTLVMFFALNPKDYEDTKYYPHDMSSNKSFEETPMMIKIKSARGVNNAIELIDIVLEGEQKVKEPIFVDYKVPKMTDKQLLDKGFAKIVKSNL